MLRSVWVWLMLAATAAAAPIWDGSPDRVRITRDPGAGKIAVKDGVLSVSAENPLNENSYLFFEIECAPFSLKDKALAFDAWTDPAAQGCSFYVFCHADRDKLPAAFYSTGGALAAEPRGFILVPGRDGALHHFAKRVNVPTDKPVTRIVIATCRGPRAKLAVHLRDFHLTDAPPPPVELAPVDLGRTVAGGTCRGAIAVQDGKGRDALFVFLMDDCNRRSLQIDAETGETTVVPVPIKDRVYDSVYASCLSRRNRIYTHYNCHFLEYDPAQKKYTFCRKTSPQMAMAVAEGPDGVIWSATYPNCGLVSYDPASGKFADHGSLNQENWAQYPRSLMPAKDGWVYIGVGSTRPQIVAFRPADGKTVKLLSGDAERPNPASADIRLYADGGVYANVKDIWYKLENGARTRLDAKPASTPVPQVSGTQGLFHGKFPSGRRLWAKDLDLPEGTMTVRELGGGEKTVRFKFDNPGVPMMAVDVTSDGILGGGSFFPFRFAALDLASGKKTDQKARFQCNTVAAHGKYLYLGCYSGGQLLRYDPSKPWTWDGTMASKEPSLDSNPVFYGKAHPDIHRPHGLAVSPDGKSVVMAGTPGYGLTGGGLAVLRTDTGKFTVYSSRDMGWHPEASYSIAILPGGRALVGTTVLPGTGGETLAEKASLQIVDLATGKARKCAASPGTGVRTVLNLLPLADGTVLGVTDRQTLFRYDPVKDRVLASRSFGEYGMPAGGQGPRILLADGKRVLLLLTSGVAEVDPADCRITRMMLVKGGIHVGGGIYKGMLYYSVGNRLKGVKLP